MDAESKILISGTSRDPFHSCFGLFPSGINKQFDQCMSYRPDSLACYIDHLLCPVQLQNSSVFLIQLYTQSCKENHLRMTMANTVGLPHALGKVSIYARPEASSSQEATNR